MMLLFVIKIFATCSKKLIGSIEFLEPTDMKTIPDDFLNIIEVENASVVKEVLYTYCDRMKEIISHFISDEQAFRTVCNESFRLISTHSEDLKSCFMYNSFNTELYDTFIFKQLNLSEMSEPKWEKIILDILGVFYYHANTRDIQYFINACEVIPFGYHTLMFSEQESLLIQFVPDFLDTRIQAFMIMRGNQSVCLKFDTCITNFLIDAIVSHSFNKL